MGASAGEKCGWCATPQFAGALICRSCGAKRKQTRAERGFDKTLSGLLGGGLLVWLLVKQGGWPWLLALPVLIITTVIGFAIDSIPRYEVTWNR
jgi:hypothetical protein